MGGIRRHILRTINLELSKSNSDAGLQGNELQGANAEQWQQLIYDTTAYQAAEITVQQRQWFNDLPFNSDLPEAPYVLFLVRNVNYSHPIPTTRDISQLLWRVAQQMANENIPLDSLTEQQRANLANVALLALMRVSFYPIQEALNIAPAEPQVLSLISYTALKGIIHLAPSTWHTMSSIERQLYILRVRIMGLDWLEAINGVDSLEDANRLIEHIRNIPEPTHQLLVQPYLDSRIRFWVTARIENSFLSQIPQTCS